MKFSHLLIAVAAIIHTAAIVLLIMSPAPSGAKVVGSVNLTVLPLPVAPRPPGLAPVVEEVPVEVPEDIPEVPVEPEVPEVPEAPPPPEVERPAVVVPVAVPVVEVPTQPPPPVIAGVTVGQIAGFSVLLGSLLIGALLAFMPEFVEDMVETILEKLLGALRP